jgi:hypothetical protein
MTTEVANGGNGENASAPAAAKAAPKDPWALPDVSHLVVGVLGGTDDQGRGLAYRLARAGQRVILGSRDADRARRAAAELGRNVEGADNAECARRSDIVIVAVPWDAHADIVQALAGRVPGMRGIYAGRLRNAHQVESLVANLISANRRYKAHAGLRATDV